MTRIITFEEADPVLDWIALTDYLVQAHRLPKAKIADTFLYRGDDTLLSRSAWIDGLGVAVKSATIFPANPGQDLPMVNGAVSLFSDTTGQLEALIDFHLITKWKTAGDSLLAARLLARPDSRNIVILGAGTVCENLISAYGAVFPEARFSVWNRTRARADAMAASLPGVRVVEDLPAAVAAADIVACATMSRTPVLRGEWLCAGTHVDLIGAYRPDMREADDAALQRSSLFVDSFETTINHIGELMIPLESGAIARSDVVADFYDHEAFTRTSEAQITIAKNGGGAHLDLMTCRYVVAALAGQ